MKLGQFLSEKKTAIVAKWFDAVLETYPSDTSKFLKKQENRFTNPVGHTILEGLEKIFDGLLDEADTEKISTFLDNIIRVRAVQDLSASQAVGFIFSLKKVIKEELENDKREVLPYEELFELNSKIDAFALLSFDIFMKCREKIYDIKANELRKMTFRLLQRVNTLSDVGEQETGPADVENDNVNQKEVNK